MTRATAWADRIERGAWAVAVVVTIATFAVVVLLRWARIGCASRGELDALEARVRKLEGR